MAGKRKAAGCRNSSNRNKKIKRQDDQDHGTYTSQLPDLVVYQILKLLPTKFAFRASILSKQWGRVLPLVPVLDFDDEQSCDRERQANLRNCLRSCLKRRKADQHEWEKFRLCMKYGRGAKIIDKWLSLAVERNVKELSIMLSTRTNQGFSGQYNLSPMVFINAKSLTSLNLKNVRLHDDISTNTISLPFLKSMSLEKIDLRGLGFLHSISRCPSIEYLKLTSCVLRNAEISSSSLKYLEVTRCKGTTDYYRQYSDTVGFRIEAINLHSFRLCGANYASSTISTGNIDFFSCQALRRLEIRTALMDRQIFDQGFHSKFRLLESLTLDTRWESSVINFHLEHLKHLVIGGLLSHELVMNINTPNLLSFTFNATNDYLLRSNISINAPNLAETAIDFRYLWATEDVTMLKFLGTFECCRKLSLSVEKAMALLIFAEETRQTCSSPLPSLKHLKVVTESADATDSAVLKDSLLWMAPNLGSLYINETEVFSDYVVMNTVDYLGGFI